MTFARSAAAAPLSLPAGALGALVVLTAPAAAHPHVWVESRSVLLFDGAGTLAGVRHQWTFDEYFSAYATQGMDTDGDGRLSREELQPLAEVNVESLHEFDFFTFVGGDSGARFEKPVDYWLDHDGTLLTLHFTLPLAEAVDLRGGALTLEVFDPTFFVDFSLAGDGAAETADAPATCELEVERAEGFDMWTQMQLSQIPADAELPPELFESTSGNANAIHVTC